MCSVDFIEPCHHHGPLKKQYSLTSKQSAFCRYVTSGSSLSEAGGERRAIWRACEQTLDEAVADSCRQMIAWLSQERASIEAQLELMLLEAQDGQVRGDLLRTIPGVGPAVSMTLLADLPELGSLDRKAVGSLAGLAPHPNQSGTRTGAAHIGGGRPCVRAALYMAAVSATRTDKGFKREYMAMRQAGKPAKVALVAIARKIVVAANSMLKSGQPWQKPD